MQHDERLELLLAHSDTHAPVLEAGLPSQLAGSEARAVAADDDDDDGPLSFMAFGADGNSLKDQRWCVLAPPGKEGQRLVELIRPLIAARAAEQGREVAIYQVPPGLSPVEAARWRKTSFDTSTGLASGVPRYQLILGDLDQISLGVQQTLAADLCPGRLAFPDDRGYEAYVEKLLRWEKQPVPVPQGRALFFSVHGQPGATETGYNSLVTPGLKLARQGHEAGQFAAADIVELGSRVRPDPNELLTAARQAEASVLFSLSHGEGPPMTGDWASDEAKHRGQGAMSFGGAGRLCGDDLTKGAFLPGGVWFMFACYGAGTPSTSAYHHWLSALKQSSMFHESLEGVLRGLPRPGDRPFVAALPQAVLANPDGPLAFIGHVDLAWTYGFQERDLGPRPIDRPGRFVDVIASLLGRDRVGVSYQSLMRFFGQVNTELSAMIDADAAAVAAGKQAPASPRRSHLWMARQDLAGYIVLGDPAARLPLAGAPPVANAIPAVSTISTKPIESGIERPASLSLEKLEVAIGHVLVGDTGINAIAETAGLTRAELERIVEVYRRHGRTAFRG